jgi:hypothetical protein
MKPQPKAQVIHLRLDSDDVEGDQIKYLRSILRKHSNEPSPKFSIRFNYDTDGTAHWDGRSFVIDVTDGVCHLRLASMIDVGMDASKAKKINYNDKDEWIKVRRKLEGKAKDLATLVVSFSQSVYNLKAEDLHEGLKMFQVGDVMFI